MITRRALIGSAGSSLALMSSPARAEEGEATFEAGAVRQDLDAIWSALREVSPDPFRAAQASQAEAAYKRVRAGLAAPMTMRTAWLAISPVLGALNDGHVALGFDDALNASAQRFPLRLATTQRGDQLLVERDRTGSIPPRSRVVSIEGAPATAFLRTNLAAFGGQTPALARWRVTASGAWTAVALFGAKPGYRVRWTEPSGVEHEAIITVAAAKARAAPSESYSFRWLRKDVGLIDYRRCEDLARFRTFVDATFAQLRAGSATALVIDVRRNAGGDSDLNDLLWSYAQAKPFRQFGGTVERSSDRLKRAYGRDKYVQLYGEEAWAAPDGAIIRQGMGPADGLVTPGPLAVRFTGPVYLLISAGTFSSAMSCALAAKDYGLATLVGQETGEPANSTGELYALTTPNLKMQAYLTTKLFLAPKPHPDGQGVVPDVQVHEEVARSDGDADAVLERTLALIDARRAVRS
jgi:hypothetical protein